MASLSAALESSWQVTVGCSALLGVLFHHAIRPFEIDSRGWSLVFAYMSGLATLFVGYITSTSFGVVGAILRTSSAGTAFIVGLFSSMLVYRAFFHRLRRFPGPFAARLSNLYHFVMTARTNMQHHLVVQKLHQQYGDFVRTGPRELSITRVSAINLIYGPASNCRKATWYDQNSDDPKSVAMQSLRDKDLHRLRRRAWDKGLGFRALATYETRVKAKVDLLLSRLGEGRPLDMTQYGMFFGFDLMGDVGFSKGFHMLETGQEHPAIHSLHEAMDVAGLFTTLPWLMNMLRRVPGATGVFESFAKWCYDELRVKRETLASEKAINKNQEPRDVISWLIKAVDEGDPSAPPSEAALQEDARVLIIAGSDTAAATITNALYYLVKYPAVYQKLQREMETEFPGGDKDWTYDKAKKNTYLDYIIHETLRLRPAAPIGFLRQTPPEGLQVDEVFIPGDTIVSVPTWTIHRHPPYWDRPDEFVPERWEKLSTDKGAYIAFQRGPFTCVGKHFAMMQLRMILSRIALRYNIAFPPGEDGVAFEKGAKEKMTLWVPPLQMVFTSK